MDGWAAGIASSGCRSSVIWSMSVVVTRVSFDRCPTMSIGAADCRGQRVKGVHDRCRCDRHQHEHARPTCTRLGSVRVMRESFESSLVVVWQCATVWTVGTGSADLPLLPFATSASFACGPFAWVDRRGGAVTARGRLSMWLYDSARGMERVVVSGRNGRVVRCLQGSRYSTHPSRAISSTITDHLCRAITAAFCS